jgi:alpha-tubulin suppressor-like RCC1 family protein
MSLATAALTFYQMSGGGEHTCAVTTENAVWCWGYNASGQLGAGTLTGPESCTGAAGPFPCSSTPVRVVGGLRFRQISAGEYHTCAVSTAYQAYCWGSATTVGDGTEVERPAPVAVAGGHLFRQVDAGLHLTCGVSYPDNKLYCWGANSRGQLGDGSLTQRLSPVLVLGGLRFLQVSAGGSHACGVTTTFSVYCWGDNKYGQLGDSTTQLRRARPIKVVGGHLFRQVDAGGYHTCAVTTGYRVFCWGDGQFGQIGNGKTFRSRWPRAVSSALSFRRATAGIYHSCAETLSSRAWCWGTNSYGQLGNGSPQFTRQATPVAVAGGLSFGQMSAGGWHTCGKQATTSAGFCWGYGFFGQLGDGRSSFGVLALTPGPVMVPLQNASTPLVVREDRTDKALPKALPWEEDARASGRVGMVPEP